MSMKKRKLKNSHPHMWIALGIIILFAVVIGFNYTPSKINFSGHAVSSNSYYIKTIETYMTKAQLIPIESKIFKTVELSPGTPPVKKVIEEQVETNIEDNLDNSVPKEEIIVEQPKVEEKGFFARFFGSLRNLITGNVIGGVGYESGTYASGSNEARLGSVYEIKATLTEIVDRTYARFVSQCLAEENGKYVYLFNKGLYTAGETEPCGFTILEVNKNFVEVGYLN